MLDERGSLVATTAAGERWLWELSGDERPGVLPLAVAAVVAHLDALHRDRTDVLPRVHVQSRTGRWVVLHASEMRRAEAGRQIAVVVEPASGVELAPLMLLAYGLTPRETEVAQAALQGKTNKATARDLRISEHTVEDHLKAIFTKVGVSTRGELTAHLLRPRVASRPVADGYNVARWAASL